MRGIAALVLLALLPAAAAVATPQDPAPAPSASDTVPQSAGSRTFDAPVGVVFTTVRPDRVADFENVLALLRDAMARSADETVRAQARGWRMFKADEAGPNNTVVYVFLLDPAVAGADYGFGRILAEAYPEGVRLQEIWTLYTGAVTGGSLLNLRPVAPVP